MAVSKTNIIGFIICAVLLIAGGATRKYLNAEALSASQYAILFVIVAVVLIIFFVKIIKERNSEAPTMNQQPVQPSPPPAPVRAAPVQPYAAQQQAYAQPVIQQQQHIPQPSRLDALQAQEEEISRRLQAMDSAPAPSFHEVFDFEDRKKKVEEEEDKDYIEQMVEITNGLDAKRKKTAKTRQAEYDNLLAEIDLLQKDKAKVATVGKQLKTQFLRLDNEIFMKEKQAEMMEKAGIVVAKKK